MVGLNYDGGAWVIIGTGRYAVFIHHVNDEFSQDRKKILVSACMA